VFHAVDIYRPSTVRTLTRAIQQFRPDVVHTHSVQGLSSAALEVPSRRGIAHVHTLHDYWLLCQRTTMVSREGKPCDELCRSCAMVSWARNSIVARHPPTLVIAISEAVAREHARLAWTRGRIRVVPHPVEWLPEPPKRTAGPVMFGYLGQLTRVKGVEGLLEAFRVADVGDARLLIAGDGPERVALRALAGPGVEFTGWLDPAGKAAFLDRIDCLVVPSEWKEPAGLVVNEARGHYVPVLAARIGGIPELVPAASRPLLFPPGDRAELARRMEDFVRSPEQFRELRSGAGLDWTQHAGLVVRVYDDARRAVSMPGGRRS
jgi:glycosyltransferase involved in cell wall biosynthesis